MFHHDPLSSLSSYGRTCANSQAMANSHMAYGSGLGSGPGSHGKETSKKKPSNPTALIVTFSGVLSPGLSVPLQVPGQTHDLASNYWPRLQ